MVAGGQGSVGHGDQTGAAPPAVSPVGQEAWPGCVADGIGVHGVCLLLCPEAARAGAWQ